ncbi:MAG: zinc/iron transporter [Gemmatimonadetes bacterium]|nr:zinc/iron transporter [Gemmatimonadota bacterium]
MNAALLYALAAAGANVLGGLVITTHSRGGRTTQRLLIAFGAGFMLAVALLAMLPHTLREGGANAAVTVLVGYLLVHLTQHVLTPHFHFGEETHHVGHWTGVSALLGLLLHTFFDGVAIASGFRVGSTLGFLVFIAILLHKIPEGVTVASVMLASGNTRRMALGGTAALGVATVLGVLVTDQLGALQRHGLALSAGVTLYVAASNLMPEVQQERSRSSAIMVFVGAACFLLAWWMLGGEA